MPGLRAEQKEPDGDREAGRDSRTGQHWKKTRGDDAFGNVQAALPAVLTRHSSTH